MGNKTQEEPLFLAAPFFMVRIPLLPIEHFYSLLEREDMGSALLVRFAEDPLLREAIMIASATLYKALSEKKDKTQSIKSLSNYFNRMCSRPTPFGLFSSVSLGEWAESASMKIDLDLIYKKARPDMEWLALVIDQLCKDPTLLPFLSVKKNPLLYVSGGRVFLNYIRAKKANEAKKNPSIRRSFLTDAIFELTQKPIAIEDLKDKLVARFPTLEREKLDGMIEKLLQQQFLDFGLRPSLLSESPFADVLSNISVSRLHSDLHNIAVQIDSYNQLPGGQGQDIFQQIQQMMGQFATAPHFLQVDAGYKGTRITLPKAVIDELQKSTELLWKIADITSPPSLHSYHQKFLDKYGTFRTVPLMQLLTKEGGLGSPEIYTEALTEKKGEDDAKGNRWNEWLKTQWATCLREGLHEIQIDEKIVDEMNEKAAKERALLSFDLRCEVLAETAHDINQGRFLLQIEPFAWQAGATFGRFINVLGEGAKGKLQAFLKEEEALEEEALFAESSYHHMGLSRSANVMIHPNLRKDSIDLGGTGTISLDEIYIGATMDRLYVTRKDGGQELRITSGNMLNPSSAPLPLRFIRDVSKSKYRVIDPFSWHELATAFFLPRIRFRNTILSPAQWKVDLLQLNCTSKEKIETIEAAFCQWADRWQLPRHLMMSEEDTRLLLDRYHPLHQREIALEIKKGKKVHLIEKVGQAQTGQIQSQKGTHYAEFIIPFVKNKKYCSAAKKPLILKHQTIANHSRWKLPGSDWLFVKYYLGPENENRVLLDECYRWANSLLKRDIITGWFFVRYADPKSHLRLRFCGKKEQLVTQLIPEIHDRAMALIQNCTIEEMTFSAYEREIERYGAEELIEATEALFCADTETTLLLLQAMLENKSSLGEEVVAACSFIDLLKGLGLTIEEQITLFSSFSMSKEELAGFRQWKTALLSLCGALFEDQLPVEKDAIWLREAFQKRTLALKAYVKRLQEVKEQQKLITPVDSIYDSLIHMHYNRLFGRSGKEKKARLYAYHVLTLFQAQKMRLVAR